MARTPNPFTKLDDMDGLAGRPLFSNEELDKLEAVGITSAAQFFMAFMEQGGAKALSARCGIPEDTLGEIEHYAETNYPTVKDYAKRMNQLTSPPADGAADGRTR